MLKLCSSKSRHIKFSIIISLSLIEALITIRIEHMQKDYKASEKFT